MIFDLTSYLWLLYLSALTTAFLGLYAWKHRAMPGAAPFALLMLVAVIWALANGREMAGTTLPVKLFWANLQYFCYATIPVLWLALALQFTGRERWLRPPRIFLLLVIPLVTNILVWTNPLHELIRRNVFLDTEGPFSVVGKTYGPWMAVHSLYSYILIAIALYLLIKNLVQVKPPFRGQLLVLIIGFILPLVWNALYTTGLSPIKRHDIAPAVLSLSSLVVGWGLFRFRLFDILPVAHDAVLISIRDGVIVLDANRRIVTINRVAQDLFDWSPRQVTGRPAAQVFDPWPGIVQLLQEEQEARTEITLQLGGAERTFDLALSPLLDQLGRPIGQLLVLYEITQRKRVEEELRALSLTDSLTGLYNRRKFLEELRMEIDRARRYEIPLTVIMIDVNDLKRINDALGHHAGDQALEQIAGCIRNLRQSDISARLGGDEFALLLPFTALPGGMKAAWRLYEAVRSIRIGEYQDVSMSLGVAQLEAEDDEQGERLLARADQAMYLAKRSGRGCLAAGSQPQDGV